MAPSVAAYALGEDYHTFLLDRMQALVDYLLIEVGQAFEYRIYTDTGRSSSASLPSGLAWVGSARTPASSIPSMARTCCWARSCSISSLTTTAPFVSDQCGTCTRCIEACPTGCILPDRTLDAGRCISYLTIEEKGEIPEALRPALGEWLFGCDICQQVCPWNVRFAAGTKDASFRARGGLESTEA